MKQSLSLAYAIKRRAKKGVQAPAPISEQPIEESYADVDFDTPIFEHEEPISEQPKKAGIDLSSIIKKVRDTRED